MPKVITLLAIEHVTQLGTIGEGSDGRPVVKRPAKLGRIAPGTVIDADEAFLATLPDHAYRTATAGEIAEAAVKQGGKIPKHVLASGVSAESAPSSYDENGYDAGGAREDAGDNGGEDDGARRPRRRREV